MQSARATASMPGFFMSTSAEAIYRIAWRAATSRALSQPPSLAARRLFVILTTGMISFAQTRRVEEINARMKAQAEDQRPRKRRAINITNVTLIPGVCHWLSSHDFTQLCVVT